MKQPTIRELCAACRDEGDTMSMPLVTIIAGLALAVLGVGTFLGTGSSHLTALIPAGLGGILLVLGILGQQDKMRKHAMHGAAALSLLGVLGGAFMGMPRWIHYLQEGKLPPRADGTDPTISTLAMLAMTLICLVLLALCVNSFIQARRKARQEAASKT
jgi:hypothetical protein